MKINGKINNIMGERLKERIVISEEPANHMLDSV